MHVEKKTLQLMGCSCIEWTPNVNALLTMGDCWYHIGLRNIIAQVDRGGVPIKSFKQALHLAVATAEYYDVVGIDEVGRWPQPEPQGNLVESGQEFSRLCNWWECIQSAAFIRHRESLSTKLIEKAKSTKHITVAGWKLQRCSSVRRRLVIFCCYLA